MKKSLVLIIFIMLVHHTYSQTQFDSIIKSRLNFSTKKSKLNYAEKVILDKDTLFSSSNSEKNLDALRQLSQSEKSTLYTYRLLAFNSSKIKQWSVPIIVYFDKNIPKKIKKEFKNFYEQVKGIDNLSISFTSNLDKANYYIKPTKKTVNGYSSEYKFKSVEEKEKSVLTGATYNLNTDKNSKFFAGALSINYKRLSTPNFIKQLKQLFFLSLFNSHTNNYVDKSSLLSKQYEDSVYFSQYDLDLLKIHYSIIYDQKVDSNTFNAILQLLKNQ